MKRFLLFTALVVITTALMAQNKQVAVWETKCTDGSITGMQSLIVRGGMETAIANARGYTGFDRAAFDDILKEHNFQRSGAVKDDDIRQMGVMAGVQYIIVPEAMASDDGDFYIVVKMLDIESGQYGAAYEELCSSTPAEIKKACARLGEKLFGVSMVDEYEKKEEMRKKEDLSDRQTQDLIDVPWWELLKKTAAKTRNANGECHIGDNCNGNNPLALHIWGKGGIYIGHWGTNCNSNGEGMYFDKPGESVVYVGPWNGDYRHGKDARVYDNGGELIYIGKFKDDYPTGQYPIKIDLSSTKSLLDVSLLRMEHCFNVRNYENGDKYVGEAKMNTANPDVDLKNGWGLYIWANGNVWYGEWSNDKMNGIGIYINNDGTYYYGTWQNGKRTK
ncbi:MAG: hypothetical protein J6T88_10795 [Bacteroidales bacterium]|nr:hypothetical protein [Bacteroidales bacterium]